MHADSLLIEDGTYRLAAARAVVVAFRDPARIRVDAVRRQRVAVSRVAHLRLVALCGTANEANVLLGVHLDQMVDGRGDASRVVDAHTDEPGDGYAHAAQRNVGVASEPLGQALGPGG